MVARVELAPRYCPAQRSHRQRRRQLRVLIAARFIRFSDAGRSLLRPALSLYKRGRKVETPRGPQKNLPTNAEPIIILPVTRRPRWRLIGRNARERVPA